MFCHQPRRNGVAADSPTDNNRLDVKDPKMTGRASESDSYQQSKSEPEIFGEGSRCPIRPTKLRVLQGILPKGPDGFSTQHNSSN